MISTPVTASRGCFACAVSCGNGAVLWTKKYGLHDYANAKSIIPTNNRDGYIVAGKTSNIATSSYDMWILNIDENGDTLWTTTVGGDWTDGANDVIGVLEGIWYAVMKDLLELMSMTMTSIWQN